MKSLSRTLIGSTLLLAIGTAAQAQSLSISIQNITSGIYFTPFLVSAHNAQAHLYQLGYPASAHLQAMAEGGDISGLASDLDVLNADQVSNPAEGLLAPGATVDNIMLDLSDGNNKLSIVAMLLPTNDGFVGLDSWSIPTEAGTYTFYLNGYDAGTEANNELINSEEGGMPGVLGIPAAPGGDAGSGGMGVTTLETNTNVHIHRGVLGDYDPMGGKSDLDASIHRWLNPIAKVTVIVE